MRFHRFPLLLVFALIAPFSFAQQTTSSTPQALALLQQSLAALTGGQSLTDVTLSGTARRIVGSNDESGSAVLKAIAAGAGRMDVTFPSGPRSELQNSAGAGPLGFWSGPDGVSHPISNHNLMTDSAWFFPALMFARLNSPQGYVVSYIGQETRNGQPVVHLSAIQQFPNLTPKAVSAMQHLSQTEIFLDPSTNFPLALAFNVHPDNDAFLDIPVEIRFSDYRSASSFGVAAGFSLPSASSPQIPFHIQKFLNNSLLLDFQAQTVSLNSGLSPTDFVVAGLQTGSSPPPASSAVAVSDSAREVRP